MIQLALIALCGIGCVITLISTVCSLLASIRRSRLETPFLAPVPGPSCDGKETTFPFGLMQVQRLEEPPQSGDQEEQG